MKSLSIGLRLTAWYSLILAGCLAVFGTLAFYAMSHSIRATVDAELQDRIKGVREIIADTAPEGIAELKDELREFAEVRAGGDLLRVADDHGQVLYDSFNTQVRRRFDSAGKPLPLFTRRIDGTLFRILSQQVEADGKMYQVQVAVLTQRFDQAEDIFVWILSVSAPLFLVLAGLGGYWISRRALSPVDEITNAARTIGAQNLAKRLAVPKTGDELERLADTLNGMLGRLDAAFKRITQFTGDASHELRTPVSVIRTSAELTLRKPRSEKEYQEALGQILTEAERTSQMIEQLLDLARADSGPAALAKTATNVSEPFHEACRQAQVLAESKQLKFTESMEPEGLWIQGDAPSLERLFLILLDNAVKYTPNGGSVQARLAAENGFVLAEVKDTGIGIKAEDIPHVFDRFYRADRARSRETGGSGLGLAIGRWIAEAHGGEIHVQSEPAKGSSFQIRFPRLQK